MTLTRKIVVSFLFLCFIKTVFSQISLQDHPLIISRLKKSVSFLASDSLEGRGTGSKGEKMAAIYIANRFHEIGLLSISEKKSFSQSFTFTSSKQYGSNNSLKISSGSKLKEYNVHIVGATKNFYPISNSANGKISGELVNVGFGISAPALLFDDYKLPIKPGQNIFLMEYFAPDGNNPHSKYSEFAEIQTKIETAISKGAKGILFHNSFLDINDPEFNKLHKKITASKIPVAFISREIAQNLKTAKNIKINMATHLIDIKDTAQNIFGYIDNKAENVIIIGAHYDHLGYGEEGSLYRGERAIHNGADDNASGTAAVIEIARYIKNNGNKNYNYLFVAFSGEELGLFGSNYFVKNLPVSLEKINCMINLDMVGRLDNQTNKLGIHGTGTSTEWNEILRKINIDSLEIKTTESGVGPSDHTSFYLKNIPVLHYYTGAHEDYHKPSDDEEKINYLGIIKVMNHILTVINHLEKSPKLVFTTTKDTANDEVPRFKVTLGIVPDYMYEGEGVKIDGVTDGKPASVAGLKTNDIVIQMGENKITDMMSYMKALSKFKKGDEVKVVVKRATDEKTYSVIF